MNNNIVNFVNKYKTVLKYPYILLRDTSRFMSWIRLFFYHIIWRKSLAQLHHWIFGEVQILATRLSLSPHRAATYLLLYWIFGSFGILYLEDKHYLVMTPTNSNVYVDAQQKSKDVNLSKSYSKAIPDKNKNDDSTIACRKSIDAPFFALDLLLPIFKLNESSNCTFKPNIGKAWINYLYKVYSIFGIILAGLTLFSWAGILQNRLSRK